jgi:2',3'-cyclic-nucleotide 2'-phosphodiesterase (5'-nucleotidase family)
MIRHDDARAWLVGLVVAISIGIGMLGASQASTLRELTILHFNDLHARLRPDQSGYGGLPQLANLLRQERAAASASLTLYGGDLVQGTPMSTLFEGVPAFDLANYLGVDVACLGNHEFDYGWEKIHAFSRTAHFPLLAANVVNAAGDRLLADPYVLRDVGGMRVAIIGALLERTGPWPPWRAAPIVDTLKPLVADARMRADLVIVLGHIQHDEMERILRELPEVGVVVAGHPHAGLPTEMNIGGRLGVNVQAFGREVGRLRLRFDTATETIVSHEWSRISVDATRYPADPATDRAVRAWESKLSAILDVPIGRSSRRMERDEVRTHIQRVLLERYKADVGYLNRIGVRDAIPEGELLGRHMWNVSPLDDRVVTLDVPGDRLLDLLDPEQPPALGPHALPISNGRRYRVATVDFIGQRWAARDPDIRLTDEHAYLADMLIQWTVARRVIP